MKCAGPGEQEAGPGCSQEQGQESKKSDYAAAGKTENYLTIQKVVENF